MEEADLLSPRCHRLEQGGDKPSGRHSLLSATLPTRGKEKGGKGRETFKLNIKTALLTTLIILIIRQNIQN